MSKGTQLFVTAVDGTTLSADLFEDIPIPVTYQVADVQNPAQRSSNFTKTVTLPGTATNSRIFGFVENPNVVDTYDSTQRLAATLFNNGQVVLTGFISLNKTVNKPTKKVEYECTLYGESTNFFSTIGDDLIKDLDWTSLNHDYIKTNIFDSWTIDKGYFYPMLEKGTVSSSTDGSIWELTGFFPGVRFNTILTKIEEKYGFNLQSAFLDGISPDLVLYANKPPTAKLSNNQGGFRGRNSGVNKPITSRREYMELATIDSDPGGLLSTQTQSWDGEADRTWTAMTVQTTGDYTMKVGATTDIEPGSATSAQIVYRVTDSIGGGFIRGSTVAQTDEKDISTMNAQHVITLNEGEILQYYIGGVGLTVGIVTAYDWEWVVAGSASDDLIKINADAVQGDSINFAESLPNKYRVRDFINDLILSFNLYVAPAPFVTKTLILEPVNDFYNDTIVDWSDKVDFSKQIETIPGGTLDSKRYLLRAKPTTDELNKLYTEEFNEIYGEIEISINNDFLKSVQTIETKYVPTVLYKITDNDRVIPNVTGDNVAKIITQNEPRWLFHPFQAGKGERVTADPWTFNETIPEVGILVYPYCGHLDDPVLPNLDINFYVTKKLYFDTLSAVTLNNLFEIHWADFFTDATDLNARLVTVFMNLDSVDIAALDFQVQYNLLNNLYRLNKIFDYDQNDVGTTKVELIQV